MNNQSKDSDQVGHEMSMMHRRLIQAKMTVWAWGIVGLAGLGTAAGGFIAMKLNNPSLATRGEWIPMLIIGGLWAWWLRGTIPNWIKARQDLEAGIVETMEGTVRYEIGTGVGLIPLMKYRVWVGNEVFQVSQAQLFVLQSGHPYRVLAAPRSRIFLEATLLSEAIPAAPISTTPPTVNFPAEIYPINEREKEILRLIAEGYANKEIALKLSLSVNTVKMYTSQLYQKMGVNRRTEAVARAREWGLLP